MEPIIVALLSVLGGSGGIAVVYRAYLDAKEKKASRTDDLGERFSVRLEKRLQDIEAKNETLERQLDDTEAYVTLLCITLARHNIEIPIRGHHPIKHKEDE